MIPGIDRSDIFLVTLKRIQSFEHRLRITTTAFASSFFFTEFNRILYIVLVDLRESIDALCAVVNLSFVTCNKLLF